MNKVGKLFKTEFIDTWKGFKNEKIKPSTLILVTANIVCLLISNIIAVKTLFVEGLAFGKCSTYVEFKLPLAVLMYAFSITISDILAEKDYIWTRRSCHLGFLFNLLMVAAFTATIYIPGTINGAQSNGMSSNIGVVLGSSWYMLIASLTSFYVGDFVNDNIFKKLKNKDGIGKGKLIKRCILSTTCGQLLDSFIFISLGLYLLPMLVTGKPFIGCYYGVENNFTGELGLWGGYASVLCSILFQFVVKIIIELIVSPIILSICKKETNKN